MGDYDRDDHRGSRSSRRRSRSRSRERRSRRRSSSRDRSRGGRDDRDRGRDKHRPESPFPGSSFPKPKREHTPPEERLAREKEKELESLERATRTIFAFNLSLKAEEKELFEFFSRAGQVTDIKIITDRHTKRSKGLAYIEFLKQEDVFAALSLTGQPLMGMPVMIKASEAEKNMAWEQQQQAKQNAAAAGSLLGTLGAVEDSTPAMNVSPTRVMLTNLFPQLLEEDIRSVFVKLGDIDSVEIARDATGRAVGYGFVQYRDAKSAQAAIAAWDNQVLAGQVIRVTPAPILSGAIATALAPNLTMGLTGMLGAAGPAAGQVLLDPNHMASAAAAAAAAFTGGQYGAALPGMANLANLPSAAAAVVAAAAAAPASSGVGELEEEESGGGYKLTAKTRAELMNRLAAAAGLAATAPTHVPLAPAAPHAHAAPSAPSAPILEQGVLGPASPIPTQCILLRNMFDPATQTGPDWPAEVAQDVSEECSKFGQVLHIDVDRNSKGFVYLKFATVAAAQAAQRALHGRWYSGHQILADFQFAQPYSAHFRC